MTETFLPDDFDAEKPDLDDPANVTMVLRELKRLDSDLNQISEAFTDEIERLQQLKQERLAEKQARYDHLRNYLMRYMYDNEIKKVDDPIAVVNLKPGAISVNLCDDIEKAVEILEAYAPETVCTVPKIDKIQVKKALLADRIPNNAYVYKTSGEPILAVKYL